MFMDECESVHARVCTCSCTSVSVFMDECVRVQARVSVLMRVCTCSCTSVHVFMHECERVHGRVCVSTSVSVLCTSVSVSWTSVRVFMHECARVHARVWACSWTSVCVFRHECERVNARVCTCSCTSVSVFMHECDVFMHECERVCTGVSFHLGGRQMAFVVPAAQHSTAAHVTRRAVSPDKHCKHTHTISGTNPTGVCDWVAASGCEVWMRCSCVWECEDGMWCERVSGWVRLTFSCTGVGCRSVTCCTWTHRDILWQGRSLL